jgi:hypothetical protein
VLLREYVREELITGSLVVVKPVALEEFVLLAMMLGLITEQSLGPMVVVGVFWMTTLMMV